MIGFSVSSSGSSRWDGSGVPAEAASLTACSAAHNCRTPTGGTLAPWLTATETEVIASRTCSRPTVAGHQAAALRLIEGGSDIVRWNSARRSPRARYVDRRRRVPAAQTKPPQTKPPQTKPPHPMPRQERPVLIAEFSARRPTDATPTWYDPDQTVAFWIRRMAQETVIHRVDAEQAAGLPVTVVPDDLAVDGVDEVLKRFLGFDVPGLDQLEGGHLAVDGGEDTITVMAGRTAWTVRPSPHEVVVDDGASENPAAALAAAPDPMLRWLWGRAGDDAVRLTGDPAWVGYLRRMLVAATQ